MPEDTSSVETPILFTGEMVRAILADQKSQTRRAFKPHRVLTAGQKKAGFEFSLEHATVGDLSWLAGDEESAKPLRKNQQLNVPLRHPADKVMAFEDCGKNRIYCHYGEPGQRLWVRETWTQEHPLAVQDGRFSKEGQAGIPGPPPVHFRVIYRADGEPLQIWSSDAGHPYWTREKRTDEAAIKFPEIISNYSRGGKGVYWTPSIHMPRWACRLLLDILSIRIERLQDISEEDAKAEGAVHWWLQSQRQPLGDFTARDCFRQLWEHVNGAGAWHLNPWVWAVEFKKVKEAP